MNRLHKHSLSTGCSVVDKSTLDATATLSCKVCNFTTDSRVSFEAHIQIHKSRPDAYQCKECGHSFAAEASWKTHVLLLHRIKKPKPDDYCMDIRTPSPTTKVPMAPTATPKSQVKTGPKRRSGSKGVKADGGEAASKGQSTTKPGGIPKPAIDAEPVDAVECNNDDNDDDDEEQLVIDESQCKPFRPRENVCSVCRRAFSSPMELQRHFRGHGMAFLKKSKHTTNPLLKQTQHKT